MGIREIVAIVGAVILAVGIFLPVLGGDGAEDGNSYFDNQPDNDISADGTGVVILLIALATVLMAIIGYGDYLWVPGLTAFWIVFWDLNSTYASIVNEEMLSLGAGWFVMLFGAVLIVVSHWLGMLSSSASATQYPYYQQQQPPYYQ